MISVVEQPSSDLALGERGGPAQPLISVRGW